MARDTSGAKNQPQYSPNGAPSDAADLSEVANYAALVGNTKTMTEAERVNLSGADLWDGLEVRTTDTLLRWMRAGGQWYCIGSTVAVVPRAAVKRWPNFSATNTFVDKTSYTDFPVAADRDGLAGTFVKLTSGSKLVLEVMASVVLASGAEQRINIALNIAGVDYSVAQVTVPQAPTRYTLLGMAEAVGVASGTLQIKPRVSTSAANLQFQVGDFLHYSIQEVSG